MRERPTEKERERESDAEAQLKSQDKISEVGWNHLTQITQQNVETNWNVENDQWKTPSGPPIYSDPQFPFMEKQQPEPEPEPESDHQWNGKMYQFLTDTRSSKINNNRNQTYLSFESQTIYSNDKRLDTGSPCSRLTPHDRSIWTRLCVSL